MMANEELEYKVKCNDTIDINDLKNTVEKLKRLEDEKAVHAEIVKEIYAEAKAKGYCVKTLKYVLKLCKKRKEQINEEDILIELYRGALDI